MATHEKEPTPVHHAIEVSPTNGDAHAADAAIAANATAPGASPSPDAANTKLTSRPRRSLRSAGRAAEDNIVKKAVKVIIKPRPQRKWDAERLLTDPKSPLAKANLRTILSNPMAWSSLNAEDHAEILALFPDQRHILKEDDDGAAARPNMESLMNDDSFRYYCAAYTESLVQGRHDPDWLAQAWAAHERRKAGDFKDFLRTKLERDWEVTLPLDEDDVGAEEKDKHEGQDGSGKTEPREAVADDTNGLKE